MSRMGDAQKLSVQQLQQAIQDGTIPPYIGIPLLQDKVKQQQQAATPPAPQQPPIAEQVMQEARGIEEAKSNLPVGYAGGGIMDFLLGDDEEDDKDDEEQSMLSMLNSRAHSVIDPIRQGISGLRSKISDYVNQTPPASTTIPTKINPNSSTFEKSMAFTLPHEAGYVNHPNDKGGPTNHGVTQQTLSGYLGRPASIDEVKNLDENTARDIYKKKFWDPIASKLEDPKAQMIAFNAAIASGPGYANRLIEKHKGDPLAMWQEHTKYMTHDIPANNPSQKVFVKGWSNRQNDLYNTVFRSEGGIAKLAQGGKIPGFAQGMFMNFEDFMGGTPYEPTSKGTFSQSQGNIPADPLKVDPKTGMRYSDPYGGAPNEFDTRVPLTKMDVLKNLNEARAAQEGARNVVAPPSRGATFRAPVPFKGIGSQSDANVYPGVSDLNYLNELLAEAKKDPNYQPYQDEINKIYKLHPEYKPKPTMSDADYARFKAMNDTSGERRFIESQFDIKPKPTMSDADYNRFKDMNQTSGERRFIESQSKIDTTKKPEIKNIDNLLSSNSTTSNSTATSAPSTSTATDTSTTSGITGGGENQAGMSYADIFKDIMGQRDDLKKQKEEDKYMSLIAAGLGIMGGTSPYALSNVGQGALAGVQNYANAARTRAAEQADYNKSLIGALRYKELGDYQRNALVQQALLRRDEIDARLQMANLSSQDRQDALAERKRYNDIIDRNQDESRQVRIENSQMQNKQFNMKTLEKMKEDAERTALATLNLNKTGLLTMTPEQISAAVAPIVQKKLNNPAYIELHKSTYGYNPFENTETPVDRTNRKPLTEFQK